MGHNVTIVIFRVKIAVHFQFVQNVQMVIIIDKILIKIVFVKWDIFKMVQMLFVSLVVLLVKNVLLLQIVKNVYLIKIEI